MYALIDCNNFYASCERLFNPSLNGKPVIVLSSNDGCVIARSNESKALGIKMGVPYFKVKEIVERNNVAIYSANLTLYGDISNRVMSIIRDHAPAVEVYSIDEAFINLQGLTTEQIKELSTMLVTKIKKWVGIPVSIGIAPTKTLAKVASKLCKQYPKLNGVCIMTRPQDINKVLSKFPINDVWGIGRRYQRILNNINIYTALDFVNTPKATIKSTMGIVGLRTWSELKSEPCITFELSQPARKQICTSRSFSKELADYNELLASLTTFAAIASQKLRYQKSVCLELYVFIYTNKFKENTPQQFESAIFNFPTATDNLLEISKATSHLLSTIFRKGYSYKKAGVILSKIVPSNSIQLSLFDTQDHSKHNNLMQALDAINAKQGKNTLKLASQGSNRVNVRGEFLSPCYTTSWSDLLKVL